MFSVKVMLFGIAHPSAKVLLFPDICKFLGKKVYLRFMFFFSKKVVEKYIIYII